MPPKKFEGNQVMSSFEANYKHEGDTQYPYLLAVSLSRSSDQFQLNRAMKMLGDWVEEYSKLSEIFKYKYSSYLPKILKLLFQAYQQKKPIQYCLARFLLNFFPTWQEFTSTLAYNIKQCSDKYSMEFIWYTCHNIVEDLNLQKQPFIIEYLTKNYEKPLLLYIPKTSVQARKILEITFLLNIHGCQPQFKRHAHHWSQNFSSLQSASSGSAKINIMIEIIKNKNLLQSSEKSNEFWFQEVQLFLDILEERIETMDCKDVIAKSLLDLFIWLFDLPQIKEILIKEENRYCQSLLRRSRPKGDPDYIFLLPKYQQIRQNLYNIYFKRDSEQTQKRLFKLLDQFICHSYSVFNDEYNYTFLECLSEKDIKLSNELVTDLIKLLSNNHVRRSIQAKVIMLLGKTITAALNSCQLTSEIVGQCLKAFNESTVNKINDPNIDELRRTTTKLFLNIMLRYTWQDGIKNDTILNLCEEYQRNSKVANDDVISILQLLVVKFGFNNETKMEPIINDIFYKSITNQEQLHSLISLLVTVGTYLNYPRASALVQELCAKNPSPHANFFLFQALILTRKGPPSEVDYQTIKAIFSGESAWDSTRIDINLMMIQIFFLKLQPADALAFLKNIDDDVCQRLVTWYSENNYRLLTLVAGEMLGAVGGNPDHLQSLKTYRWIREYSFEMLARSFYKTTSITVCYVFSNIILKSEKPSVTISWLSKEKFLDYLYQGLNDFLSKQKKFTKEIATSILVYKLLKNEPSLIPTGSKLLDFSTLIKNVAWWDETKNQITFCPFEDKKQYTGWTLPEFKTYYEQTINKFFKNYFKDSAEKRKKAEEMEKHTHEDELSE